MLGPTAETRREQGGVSLRPLASWHLLSLDAPCVASLWSWFLPHAFAVEPPHALPAAMFVVVWALYAADRLLDARAALRPGSPGRAGLQPRHLFHALHRRAFLAGLVLALAVGAPLVAQLGRPLLLAFAALGALLCGWFALVHGWARGSTRLPKEIAVGVFFSLALLLPLSMLARPTLATVAAGTLFAALCTLNCLLIGRWESAPALRGRWLRPAALALASLAAFAGTLARQGTHAFAAIALAALLLAVADRFRARFEATTLRAVADLALLTPLLLLGGGR